MWVLIWVYLSYGDDLSTMLPRASTKSSIINSKENCEKQLEEQLDVNDTRYMVKHGDGQLLCVELMTTLEGGKTAKIWPKKGTTP